MPHYIVRLTGPDRRQHYLIWSTLIDAPVTRGMSRSELMAYCRRTYYGVESVALTSRLARLDAKGTSSIHDACAEDTVRHNRAGPGETCLSVPQIIARYCTEE